MDRDTEDRAATPSNGDVDMGEAEGGQEVGAENSTKQEPTVDSDEVTGEKTAENAAASGEQSEAVVAEGDSPATKPDAMEVDPAPTAVTPADTPIASGPASPKATEVATETVDDLWAKQLQLLKQTPSHILNCYAIDLCPTGRCVDI